MFAQPVVDALASVVGTVPAQRDPPGRCRRAGPRPARSRSWHRSPTPAAGSRDRRGGADAELRRRRPLPARTGPRAARCSWRRRSAACRPVDGRAAALPGPAPDREQVLLAVAARSVEGAEAVDLLGDVATVLPLGPLARRRRDRLAGRAGHGGRGPARSCGRTGGHPLFVVEVLRALAQGDAGLPAVVADAPSSTASPAPGRTPSGCCAPPRCWARRSTRWSPRRSRALRRPRRCEPSSGRCPRGCSSSRAGSTSSRTTSSGRPCSPPRRRRPGWRWHARAADLLSADPEAVATHAEAVGDRPRAARGWLQAAERALARFVASDAISWPPGPPPSPVELDDDELHRPCPRRPRPGARGRGALRRGARGPHRRPSGRPAGPGTGGCR